MYRPRVRVLSKFVQHSAAFATSMAPPVSSFVSSSWLLLSFARRSFVIVAVLTAPRGNPYAARELLLETGGKLIDCCDRAPGERGWDRMLRAGEKASSRGVIIELIAGLVWSDAAAPKGEGGHAGAPQPRCGPQTQAHSGYQYLYYR